MGKGITDDVWWQSDFNWRYEVFHKRIYPCVFYSIQHVLTWISLKTQKATTSAVVQTILCSDHALPETCECRWLRRWRHHTIKCNTTALCRLQSKHSGLPQCSMSRYSYELTHISQLITSFNILFTQGRIDHFSNIFQPVTMNSWPSISTTVKVNQQNKHLGQTSSNWKNTVQTNYFNKTTKVSSRYT